MKSSTEAFGVLLRAHRRAAGLTQEQLAERAKISVRGLQHLEAGDAHPYPATLQVLQDALGLSNQERVSLRAAASPRTRARVPDPAFGGLPLVGRQREWAWLRGAFETAGPRPHLLVVGGEAGVGKTRLAEELLEDRRQHGDLIAAARCYAGQRHHKSYCVSRCAWRKPIAVRRSRSC